MSRVSKNDVAWQFLFEKHDMLRHIQEKSFFMISAEQINQFREARLMAKNDTIESLPKLFRQHQLNINAVSNGAYIVFKDAQHKSFLKLPDFKELKPEPFIPRLPFPLDTLEFSPQMPESRVIDFAHYAGLLQHYFGEKELVLTTRGRSFSDIFKLVLSQEIGTVQVDRVQIEVDGGYEGKNQFLILEAKSSTRSSFNIRQLYYPLQHFKNKTNKRIRTVLLSFSNGVYYFTEVAFEGSYYNYRLLENKAFELVLEEGSRQSPIEELLEQSLFTAEGVPVPQADDLNKVVDTVAFLQNTPGDKWALAKFFAFADRQGDYYGNAAAYLGLVEKKGKLFYCSQKGRRLVQIQNRNRRNEALVAAMAATPLLNRLIRLYLAQNGQLSDEQIVQQIRQEGYNLTTASRRKSTLRAWLNWLSVNYLERQEDVPGQMGYLF